MRSILPRLLIPATIILVTAAGVEAATVAKPSFNKQHGFYDSSFSVRITSSTSGATIRYTTDGSKPTSSHGTAISNGGYVSISTTTPLRAVGCKSGMTTSHIFTQTYIFLSHVLNQTRPSGYPATFGDNAGDYDMDPNIVNSSSYSGTIKNDLKAIPTLSIVAPVYEFFGTGFYWKGGGGGGQNTLEVGVSAELIYADGRAGFQIDAGMKTHSWAKSKRTLRLLFKSNYGGPSTLNYPFFGDAPLNSGSAASTFGKLILRAGGNDGWLNGWFTDCRDVTYLKDQWHRDTQIAMSGAGARGTFVHLYINGLYWGVYNPIERPDARFAATYFGGSKSDYYAGNMGHDAHDAISGSRSRFDSMISRANQDLSGSTAYNTMKQYLDIDQYIDYMISWLYTGGGDWMEGNQPNYTYQYVNNYYVGNKNNGPVKYYVWDGETAWHSSQDVTAKCVGRFNDGAWVKPQLLANYYDSRHKWIARPFRGLWRNADFRDRWAQRVYMHCYNGGVLTDSNSRSRWNKLRSYVDQAMVGESARWGDHKRDYKDSGAPVFNRNTHFRGACNTVYNMMGGNVSQLIAALRAHSLHGYPLYPATHPTVDPPPDPPSSLSAAAQSSTSIRVSWTDNSDDETGFKIDRRQSGTDPWVRIAEPGANATTRTDTGLTAGTTYYYKVKAFNAAGNSGYSNTAEATTQDNAPAIAVSTTSIEVSCAQGSDAASETFQVWNAGGSTLAYQMTDNTSKLSVSPASGSSSDSADKQTHTVIFTTADLAVGVYDRIITVADDGSGAANGPVTIDVRINVIETAPATPSGLVASAQSTTAIRLSWTDNSDNETGFKIDRRQSGTSGWTRIAEPGADTTAHNDTGLTVATKYYYMVKAYNGAGNSAYSNTGDATTQDNAPAIAVSTTSIQVSCVAGTDATSETFDVWNSGGGTLAYQITDNTSKLSVSPVSGSSADSSDQQTHTVTFTTANLAAGVYDRTITVADDGSGAANSPVTIDVQITVTEAPPVAPSGFAADMLSQTEVRLTWTDLPNETQYMLRKSLDGIDWYAIPQVYPAADTTRYTDSGLDPDTTYHYKLRGINDGGYGPYCSPISVTTAAPVPPEIAVSVTSIAVSCAQGTDAASETFQVWNSGGSTLAYQVSDNTSKLVVAPDSGTSTGSGDQQTHTVTFTTANLAVGVYDRTITVADDGSGADNGPLTIAVQITVLAPAPFTAYNDLCWVDGETTANITILSAGQNGLLVNRQTGDPTPVTLTLSGGGSAIASQGAPANAGTDAHTVFDGNVGLNGLIGYTATDLVLAFSGLNSALRYEVVLFGNRDRSDYTARTTTVVLSGAEPGFRNESTTGVPISTTTAPNDTTIVGNGYNTVNGHVARYTAIEPGADGSILLTVSDYTSKFYVNALMLRATEPSSQETLVAKGSTWRYRRGTAEPSAPLYAWRATPAFDDSAWDTGAAPFGYGPLSYGTSPDMRYNYPTLFLRQTFALANPGAVAALALDVDYDDGFILWLNGEEIARVNVQGAAGNAIAHDQTCSGYVSGNSTRYTKTCETAEIPELGQSNVVAVQLFNNTLGSGDAMFDLSLAVTEHEIAASADADGNGLDDTWESAVGTSQGAEVDEDNDGLSNYEEWVAGTAGGDPGSHFDVHVSVSSSGLLVSFLAREATGPGYTGLQRRYTLESRPGLGAEAAWSPVAGYADILGQGQTAVYTNTAPAVPMVYRGRVWLE